MAQVVTQYQTLYESMRSRRLRPIVPKGLDMVASRLGTAVKHRRSGPGYLWEEAQRTAELGREFRSMSEGALDETVSRIREEFVRRRHDHLLVRRGMAGVREVARRLTGEEAYPVQL